MADQDFADIVRGQGEFLRGLQGATRSLAGFTAGLEIAFRGAGSVVSHFTQALGALGPQAKLVEAAFATAAAEVIAFTGIIAETTNALTTFRAAMQQSGGTAADITRLAAFGIGPRQAAGASADFTARTSLSGGNPFAQAELMKLGVRPGFGSPVDELTGNVNQAGRLADTLDRLNLNYERDRAAAGGDPKQQEAVFNRLLGRMRLLGIEGSIGAVTMPRAVLEKQFEAGKLQEKVFDPAAQAQAAALNAEVNRLGMNFQTLIVALGKPFLEDFTKGIGKLADVIGYAANEVNKHPRVWRFLLGAMFPIIRIVDTLAMIFGKVDDAFTLMGQGAIKFTEVAGLAFDALIESGKATLALLAGTLNPVAAIAGAAIAKAAAAKAAEDLRKARETLNAPFGGAAGGKVPPGASGSAGNAPGPFPQGDPFYHGGATPGSPLPSGRLPGSTAFGNAGAGLPGVIPAAGSAEAALSKLLGLGKGSVSAGANLPALPGTGAASSQRGFFTDLENAFKGALMAIMPGIDFGGVSGKAGANLEPVLTPAEQEDLAATERLIQALDEVVIALKQGLFGGGPRTRGAIPPRAFDPLKATEAERNKIGWHMDRSAAARLFRYGGVSLD